MSTSARPGRWQCGYPESNWDLRFRKPLLYPLSYSRIPSYTVTVLNPPIELYRIQRFGLKHDTIEKMKIKEVCVKNFRNIKTFTAKFGPSLNLITAPNATGKTNLLEAISILSYGKSIRAKEQSDLFNNENLTINIDARVAHKEDLSIYSAVLAKENGRLKKAFFINEDPYVYSQFVARVITLFFTTSTIDLLSRSPSARRRFLDRMIWLVSLDYRKALPRYEGALRQRNSALERQNRLAIAPWTEAVVDAGGTIIEERNSFAVALNTQLGKVEKSLSFKFLPSVELSSIFEERSALRFKSLLDSVLERDLARHATSVGPHRDDWTLSKSVPVKRDLRSFGSRGEQRMAVLSLFIAILKVMNGKLGYNPILLLDDLFSELDETNQKVLLGLTESPDFQVIATTTPNTFSNIQTHLPKKCKILKL